MNENIAKLLNEQITHEFYSAYLYLDISAYYSHANLDGFGNWYMVQSQEEIDHGKKIIKYLLDREQKITLATIDAPKSGYGNYRQPLEMALKHEEFVTGLINDLYGAARDARDFRSCQFLDWYLAEQTEEEKNAHDLLAKYDLVFNDNRGIFLLNETLLKRQYTPLTGI